METQRAGTLSQPAGLETLVVSLIIVLFVYMLAGHLLGKEPNPMEVEELNMPAFTEQ